jgi:hypothetical protein
MDFDKPHPLNAPGDFYVGDGCCTMCGVPFCIAPELFGTLESSQGLEHCFVRQQPQTPDQVGDMIQAMAAAETRCIRYKGDDYSIQSALVLDGQADLCDILPVDLREEAERLAAWWAAKLEQILQQAAEQSINEN